MIEGIRKYRARFVLALGMLLLVATTPLAPQVFAGECQGVSVGNGDC